VDRTPSRNILNERGVNYIFLDQVLLHIQFIDRIHNSIRMYAFSRLEPRHVIDL